jgi:predicted GNAT family acetyltransferase
MEFQHEQGRFFMTNADGKLVAEVAYAPIDNGQNVVIERTYVDPSLRGQGIAGKLIKLVVDEARQNGFLIEPLCTYADAAFARHPEYGDVLRPVK